MQYLPVLLVVLGAAGYMSVMLGINHLLGPKPKPAQSPAVKLEPFVTYYNSERMTWMERIYLPHSLLVLLTSAVSFA